jgi:hypothetical protein
MKKLTKILGVSLTLVMALSLSLVATPAMADEEAWDAFDVPAPGVAGALEDGFMSTIITGLGPFAQTSDGTYYLYIAGAAPFGDLFMSDDMCRTWEATDWGADVGAVPVDIATSSDDPDILYVATATNVWKTDDAGDGWANLGNPLLVADQGVGAQVLTSVAVGYAGGDPHVFAGSMDPGAGFGEVYHFNDSAFASIWTDLNVGTATVGTNNTSEVYSLDTSPFFDDDTALVAAINDTGDAYLVSNQGATIGAANWDDVLLNDDVWPGPGTPPLTGATDPQFVEDFDYDDNYELFIGVAGAFHAAGAGPSLLGGVFRVTGTGAQDEFLLPDVDADIASLDLVGDMGGTSLIAGTAVAAGPPSVWYSTNDGDDWDETDAGPTGTGAAMALVIADEDFADGGEAICASSAATEGGVHLTTDFGATFRGISALDTDMAGGTWDMSFTDEGAGPLFVITDASTGPGNLSLWIDDGTNWERLLFDNVNNIDLVEASPFFTDDNTLFIADSAAPTIMRSADGGATFTTLTRQPGAPIAAWIVIDDETVLTSDDGTGAAGDIYKTTRYGRRAWDAITVDGAVITDFAKSPDYDSDGTLIVGDADSTVHISTDEGEEWDELGDGDIEADTTFDNATYVCFDSRYPATPFVYAASDDVVERCEIDTAEDWGDQEWADFAGANNAPVLTSGAANGASGIVCSDDGRQVGEDQATLYVLDAALTNLGGNRGGMWRSLNPADTMADVNFESVTAGLATGVEDFTSAVMMDRNLHLTYGSNILLALDWNAGAPVIMTYEDTLAAPIVLTSPGAGVGIDDTGAVFLDWEPLNDDTVANWELQINSDEDFPGSSQVFAAGALFGDSDYNWNAFSGGAVPAAGIIPAAGGEYFWRVRVAMGQPVLSRFSEVRSFTMEVAPPGAVLNVAPAPGEQDVNTMPSFSWGAIGGADLYEFELAADSEFTDIVTSGTSGSNVFVSDVELEYGATYYWRVRGLAFNGAPAGDWNVSVFSTMFEPEEAEPPVVIQEPGPPAEQPDIILTVPTAETPVYVWVIIAIGGLLVVAMVILIIRTRAQPR